MFLLQRVVDSAGFFTETDKLNLKFIWKDKEKDEEGWKTHFLISKFTTKLQ